jgi:hypothetical protein
MDALNDLKKQIFFELLNLVGRVFILVKYSDKVHLGKRLFTEEEKDKGIVLVFNSRMNFLWDDYGISATLVFDTSPQKCFIPIDDIIAVYSPELNTQFISSPPQVKSAEESPTIKKIKTKKDVSGNVIEVDFTKKKG